MILEQIISHSFISIYFSQNLHCPNNYNPSDFYISKLAVLPSKKDESKAAIQVYLKKFNTHKKCFISNLFEKLICDKFAETKYAQNLKDDISIVLKTATDIQLPKKIE